MLDIEADTCCSERHTARAPHFNVKPPAGRAPTAEPLAEAVLDALPQAMAVLDATGRLAYWNRAASARLTAAGWRLVDQWLHAPSALERDALARVLPNVCTRARVQLLPLSLLGRPAMAALTPIDMHGQRRALLLLDRETLCGAIELQLFASSSGLTSAESRVLAGLAHGLRPAQIAREHGVSRSTVLSQVAALRAKTHSASIISLVTRLARLPALQGRAVCVASAQAA